MTWAGLVGPCCCCCSPLAGHGAALNSPAMQVVVRGVGPATPRAGGGRHHQRRGLQPRPRSARRSAASSALAVVEAAFLINAVSCIGLRRRSACAGTSASPSCRASASPPSSPGCAMSGRRGRSSAPSSAAACSASAPPPSWPCCRCSPASSWPVAPPSTASSSAPSVLCLGRAFLIHPLRQRLGSGMDGHHAERRVRRRRPCCRRCRWRCWRCRWPGAAWLGSFSSFNIGQQYVLGRVQARGDVALPDGGVRHDGLRQLGALARQIGLPGSLICSGGGPASCHPGLPPARRQGPGHAPGRRPGRSPSPASASIPARGRCWCWSDNGIRVEDARAFVEAVEDIVTAPPRRRPALAGLPGHERRRALDRGLHRRLARPSAPDRAAPPPTVLPKPARDGSQGPTDNGRLLHRTLTV